MFKTKNTRLNLQKLYINKHSIERFVDRKTKQINFQLPKEISIILMPQRSKDNKNVEVNKLRAIIPIKNKLYIVGNIYEKNNALIYKALTILNEKQLKHSSNFARGNYLKKGYLSKRPKIIIDDKYFDESYNDYLDKIEWEEYDLDYL
jgi:hypothetical protein